MTANPSPLSRNESLSIGQRLAHAVTAYDRKQERKRCYNPNALGIYLGRCDDVAAAVAKGQPLPDAIRAGFCGPLQSFVLTAMGVAP